MRQHRQAQQVHTHKSIRKHNKCYKIILILRTNNFDFVFYILKYVKNTAWALPQPLKISIIFFVQLLSNIIHTGLITIKTYCQIHKLHNKKIIIIHEYYRIIQSFLQSIFENSAKILKIKVSLQNVYKKKNFRYFRDKN